MTHLGEFENHDMCIHLVHLSLSTYRLLIMEDPHTIVCRMKLELYEVYSSLFRYKMRARPRT